jgi:hypothetical protein
MKRNKLIGVRNADNERVLPSRGGGFIIGHVDEVNGPGATEVAEFVPTRHELIQLVKYWTERIVERQYQYFLTGCSGSSDIRLEPYAWRRVGRIAGLLGKKRVNRVLREVRASYAENQDKELWEIFTKGTPEQQEAVSAEMHRQVGAWYEIRRLGEKAKTA